MKPDDLDPARGIVFAVGGSLLVWLILVGTGLLIWGRP